jgi:hypothetical protein
VTITLRRALPLAAACALVAPPAAQAGEARATDARVAGGQTMLQVDRGVARVLNSTGVRVDLLSPATSGRSGLTFPATGGAIDPRTLRGSVDHTGGLRFRARGRSVVLSDLRYTIGARRATLSAVAGGARLTVFHLGLRRARVGSDGPLTKTASRIRATLAPGAARALNRALRVRLFAGGLRVGTVRTEVELADAVISGGATTLALDQGAADALRSLDITPGVVGAARAGNDGLAFPITRGKVDARTLAGEIAHSGGISLTRGGTRVELTDFVIGIDDSPALSALVGGRRVEILTLDVSGIRRSAGGRTVTVAGVVGRLTAAAAGALNEAFSTTAFQEGLTIGTATVRARLR